MFLWVSKHYNNPAPERPHIRCHAQKCISGLPERCLEPFPIQPGPLPRTRLRYTEFYPSSADAPVRMVYLYYSSTVLYYCTLSAALQYLVGMQFVCQCYTSTSTCCCRQGRSHVRVHEKGTRLEVGKIAEDT